MPVPDPFAGVTQWSGLPARPYDATKALLRPLAVRALPRDGLLLSALERWLRRILLAGRRRELPYSPDAAFQMSNVRPDLNAYAVTVTDAAALKAILRDASGVTDSVRKAFPAGFDALNVAWGTLFWFRQIRRDPLRAPLPTQAVVAEIYWLDVFVRERDVAVPVLRVHRDSVGLVHLRTSGFTRAGIDAALASDVPAFIDSNRILVDWHELADRLQLTNNLFYLRCCFSGSGLPGVVTRGPLGAFGRGYGPFMAAVYKRGGAYDLPLKGVSLDPDTPLDVQVRALPRFDDLEDFLTQVNACYLLRVLDMSPQPTWYDWLGALDEAPAVSSVPRPPVFPEDSRSAAEFLFFVRSVFGACTHYLQDGWFLLSYEDDGVAAADEAARGPQAIRVVGAALGPPEPPAGAASGVAAPRLSEAIASWRRSDPARAKLHRQVIDDAQACADDPQVLTQAQCVECVEVKGRLAPERASLRGDDLAHAARNLDGGAALACGAGAAVGMWLVGVGAAVGCAVEEVAGLPVGAGMSVYQYFQYRSSVNTATGEASEPCYTMPVTLDV